MDCAKTEGGEVEVACPCLPDDSLVDVLSRLPAKPLFRFKCVSKDWCSLIADRLRCRKFPQTLHGFFAGDAAESYGHFIGPPRPPVPFVDHSFSFLTKSPEIEKIVLLGSCNGLVLFGHRQVADKFDSLGYIVCNPATEEWVSVPSYRYSQEWDVYVSDTDDEDGFLNTYLIFDPAISPHFQLIQFSLDYGQTNLDEVHTFSSVTGAWQGLDLDWTEVDTTVRATSSAGCPLNGILHVAAYQHDLPEGNRDMILAIGGEGRPHRTLHWPEDRGYIVFVGQSQGHLHCLSGHVHWPSGHLDSTTMTELSIWVLEDYNAEKWVLRDTVSLSQLFKRTRGCNVNDWYVVGIHPDHGLVFFAEYWNHKLIAYDMDMKEMFALCSIHGYHEPIIPYVPYFAQSVALAKKN